MKEIKKKLTLEERGNRVCFVRKRLLSLSREEFCKDSNLNTQSLKAWELAWGGGLTETGAKKFIDRARKLGAYCTFAWLMHGIGKPATLWKQGLNITEEEEEQIAKELLVFRELDNEIDTVIDDDSMIPLFYPGTYVAGIIDESLKIALGKECIIVDENDDVYVRVLQHGNEMGKYNLCGINNDTRTAKKDINNIKIKLAAPVIWIRKLQPRI